MMELTLYKKISKELESKYENFTYYLNNPTEDFKYAVEKENYLQDFDFDYLENLIGVKFRYYQKLAIYFSNFYLHNIDTLQQINTFKNQLAYWMATGSGKTLIMKADVINYLNFLQENGEINSSSQMEIIITSSLSELIEQLRLEFEAFLEKIGKEFNIDIKVIIDTIQSLMNKDEYKKELLPNQYRLILADEAHIGLSSDKSAFKTFKSDLAHNTKQSFMFEYSATFYNISNDLQEEYEHKIVFEYNYDKFYTDFYGKDFKFGVIKADVLDEDNEVKENIKQNLDDFERKLRAFYEFEKFEDRPLLAVVGNRVGGKGKNEKEKEEAKNEISDVEKFIDYLIKLKDISNYQKTFHTAKKTDLYLIYNKVDDELLLAFDEEKPFGLINIGDTVSLIQKLKNRVCVSYRELNFVKDEWRFVNVDKKESPINILIGSRKFSAGWNSFRVSQICLINFGVGKGNTIIQIFGRGVRLKGLRNDGRRQMNYVDENSLKTQFKDYSNDFVLSKKNFESLKYLETLFIYSLKSTYLKNFIENETGIFKQKIVEDKLIEERGKIKSIVIKNSYDFSKVKNINIDKNGKVIYEYDGRKKKFDINLNVNLYVQTPKILVIDDYLWDFIDRVELEKYFLNKKFTYDIELLQALIENGNITIYYDSRLNVEKFENLLRKITNLLEKYIERNIEKQQKEYELQYVEYPYDRYKVEITFKRIVENIDMYKKILYEIVSLLKEKLNEECELPNINTLSILSKIKRNNNRVDFSKLFKKIEVNYPKPLALDPEKNKSEKNKEEKRSLFDDIIDNDTSIEKINISPDSLDEWEFKFLNDLQKYIEMNGIKNIKVLRNIPKKGSGIIGENNDFYPDFVIEYHKEDTTHVIFCDPKGIADASNFFKVCLAPYLVKEVKCKGIEGIEFHSFVITHTSKERIKWFPIKNLNENHCEKYFNLLFFSSKNYIGKIFNEIDTNEIKKQFNTIKRLFPDDFEKILPYYFVLEDRIKKSIKYDEVKKFYDDLYKKSLEELKKDYSLCEKIIKKEEAEKIFILKYILETDEKKYEEVCKKLSSLDTLLRKEGLSEIITEAVSGIIPFPGFGISLKIIRAYIEDNYKRKSRK